MDALINFFFGEKMRINKFLATCGLGSRRKCEEFITSGKVTKNGKAVKELSVDVSEDDIIMVDGKRAQPIARHIYLMLNKPKGYICSNSDEHGRKTVFSLLNYEYSKVRLFCVGRLDYDTEGLLLLTTDGDLANKLTHPRNEIEKTYIGKIEGQIDEKDLDKLRRGVIIDGAKTNSCKIKVVEFKDNITRMEITINEGKNRQIRKMFETINREIIFLKRVSIGELRLGGLSRGEFRPLKTSETEYLKKL